MEIWQYILTGGVAAAGVKAIEGVIMWALNRKAAKEDAKAKEAGIKKKSTEEELEAMKQRLDNLTEGTRAILHDRIKYLGRAYIEDEEIDFSDRADLVAMHKVYHDALGGNGNLDALMREVMKLPLE